MRRHLALRLCGLALLLMGCESEPEQAQVCEQYTVEVDGQAKPACVARAIMRLYF